MNKPRKDLAAYERKYAELKTCYEDLLERYDVFVSQYKAHLGRCLGETPSPGGSTDG